MKPALTFPPQSPEKLLFIEPIFGCFPAVDKNDRYPFSSIVELLEQYARDNDMPHLNLFPAYLGKNGPSLWVSTYDQHPNPEGHAIAAREITPFVAELLGASRKP